MRSNKIFGYHLDSIFYRTFDKLNYNLISPFLVGYKTFPRDVAREQYAASPLDGRSRVLNLEVKNHTSYNKKDIIKLKGQY